MLKHYKYNVKFIHFILPILLFSIVLLPKLSYASYIEVSRKDNLNDYYIKIAVGANRAKSPRNYYKKNIGSSRSINIGFGGNLISNNRLELNLIQRNGFKYTGLENSNKLMQEKIFATIKSETIMLNIYSDQYVTETFTPYFGLGIGYTKNKLNTRTQTFIANKVISNNQNITKKSFSWQAVAGANILVHDRISFDISYRYSQLGMIPAPNTHVSRDKPSSKLKNHEVLFGILFKI